MVCGKLLVASEGNLFKLANRAVGMNDMKVTQNFCGFLLGNAIHVLQSMQEDLLKASVVVEYDERHAVENLACAFCLNAPYEPANKFDIPSVSDVIKIEFFEAVFFVATIQF